ncbi:MAG: dTDP-4-amino-4,6-dideoxygalactose transaminase [Myxococcales bacterium]|nr:dTDP-4-amino-4,6-dideoxygalactose transaminase [Myxococcales bacterium]
MTDSAQIHFHVPFLTGRERGYIDEVFDNRRFSGNGPFSQRCQRWLEDYTDAKFALMTHSCTGALELAAMVAGLGVGDEVILPSYTFVSTATSIMRTGATPIFCEIDPATMTMDLEDAARRITPRTRALLPVHYGGVGADMKAVMALAEKHDLKVIEDAAQGLGASRHGEKLGNIGALAALSFHETKNVHCGLGGALLINDASLFERAENIWERGTDRSKFFKGLVDKYSWVELGSSFYPSELQSAFLLAQFEGIDEGAEQRASLWNHYHEGLAPLEADGLLHRPVVPEDAVTNHHCYWIRLPTPAHADDVRKQVNARGISVVIHYVPLHGSTMGQRLGWRPEDLPKTVHSAGSLLRLPVHQLVGEAERARVVETITEVVRDVV